MRVPHTLSGFLHHDGPQRRRHLRQPICGERAGYGRGVPPRLANPHFFFPTPHWLLFANGVFMYRYYDSTSSGFFLRVLPQEIQEYASVLLQIDLMPSLPQIYDWYSVMTTRKYQSNLGNQL